MQCCDGRVELHRCTLCGAGEVGTWWTRRSPSHPPRPAAPPRQEKQTRNESSGKGRALPLGAVHTPTQPLLGGEDEWADHVTSARSAVYAMRYDWRSPPCRRGIESKSGGHEHRYAREERPRPFGPPCRLRLEGVHPTTRFPTRPLQNSERTGERKRTNKPRRYSPQTRTIRWRRKGAVSIGWGRGAGTRGRVEEEKMCTNVEMVNVEVIQPEQINARRPAIRVGGVAREIVGDCVAEGGDAVDVGALISRAAALMIPSAVYRYHPLRVRIPSALTAQQGSGARSARIQRWRREQAGAGASNPLEVASRVASRSSREAAQPAKTAMGRAARQRTQTLPGNGASQSQALAMDDLTKKLQRMQSEMERKWQRTLTVDTEEGLVGPVPGWERQMYWGQPLCYVSKLSSIFKVTKFSARFRAVEPSNT
ncbi:hypothetical protein K438DRAFT_1751183 [Mycena galopus ATCC 62051]|nr:hypothetical protein K438DRAFT_1751183 [Mycena galopus ATCC 62051]